METTHLEELRNKTHPTELELCILMAGTLEDPETAASQLSALVAENAAQRAEIDRYDKTCTEVRNELTAAGIPELTEDRLSVLPLAKRVSSLVAENARLLRVADAAKEFGAAWEDINNDKRIDSAMSNLFSAVDAWQKAQQ